MSPLYRMMHAWAAAPFVWGESDCALGLADWFQRRHGVDPAAHLRGTYFDPASCQRVSGWFTDPVSVIETCLDTVRSDVLPCPRVDEPAPGDVGVVHAPHGNRMLPCGAVWLGTCWGLKQPEGTVTVRLPAVAVWSIADAP